MSSRKLTFDASRSSARHLGALPAGHNTLHASNYAGDIASPARALATPTRPAQRASLARAHPAQHDDTGLASPLYSPMGGNAQARRNPLQAITNKEQQHANQPGHGRGAVSKAPQAAGEAPAHPHTPLSAEQQREQKARLAEWIYAYRRAFPSFVFYFEGIDEATAQRLSNPIRNLGAKVETFFSAQTVTHVIIKRAELANDENIQAGSNVVALAKRFQLKIWDINKLEKRVLGLLLPGYSATQTQSPSVLSAKRKLNEAFSAEKLYNMRHKAFEGASVSHTVDFYYFKYIYVLVEDATHLSRPAIMEDYRPPEEGTEPPWPKLYMVPTGRCPFVQYEDPSTSSKGSETDAEDNKENMTPEPEPTLPTAQLHSKTPASRVRTPRDVAWTPAAGCNENEAVRKPFATVPGERVGENSQAAAAEHLLTPTRPSRNLMAGNFAATPARNDAVARPARDNALGIMDSNASGIGQSMGVTSTSTAFNVNAMDPVMQRCLLQNLNGGRVTHLSRLEQPVPSRPVAQNPGLRSRGRAPPIPRTKKARVPVRRPVVARPGYCENCREKFDDMLEHVKTPQHRRFASNERNWVELDTLLDRVRRPLRKSQAPSSTPHMYTLSSDDGSQSGSASVCSGQLHEAASLNASGHAMQGSWGSTPCSAFASAHMLASGRLSTEATDAAAETPVRAATSTASLARPAASIVDLAYSNTNSSCASPKDVPRSNVEAAESDARDPAQMADALVTPLPARNFGGVSTGVEAMVSSLETPRFRDEPADQYFDGATLVGAGPHKRPRHSAAASQQQFVTPTRAGADGAARGRFDDSGSATLVQPSRAKQRAEPTKNHASAANRSTNRREMAQDLCRMLHGDPDSV